MTVEVIGAVLAALGVGVAAASVHRGRGRRSAADRAQAELADEQALTIGRLEAAATHSADVVALVAGDGRLVWVSRNPSFTLTVAEDGTVGRFFGDFVHAPDRQRAAQAFLEILSKPGTTMTVKLRFWTYEDRLRPVLVEGENRINDPKVQAVILRIRDLSEQTQLEEQLDRLVSRDPITGVANRAQLEAHLDRAVQRRAEAGGLVAALLVDLDDFRAVADTLGHDAGDDLLRQTAMRLERAAAQGDLVARLDGDTFGLLLDHLESVEHGRTRALEILEGVRGEITLSGGHLVQLDAYCGLAFGATDLPARELIRHADIALLELSERGTTGLSLFTDQMQQRVSDRVALTGQLRRATEGTELEVDYQPIVDLETGATVAAEALVRWMHPERGRLAPAAFVELAEQTGIIRRLGEQVLRAACSQTADLLREHPGALEYVSVNVSPRQLEDGALGEIVASALSDAGLQPQQLVLEVTETSLASDPERMFARLAELREQGVRIALDDFGAGYSLLSFLEGYPLDLLKIDRSLVRTLGERDDTALLLSGLVQIGERHGLTIIAEGIETPTQRRRLAELGLRLGQGYLFARPGAPEALTARP